MKQKLLKSSTYLNEINFDLYPELKSYVVSPLINWIKNLFIAKNMQDKNKKKIISQESAYYKGLLDVTYSMSYQLKLFKHIAINSHKNEIVFNQGSNLIVSSLEGTKLFAIKAPVNIFFPYDDTSGEIIPSPDCKYIAYTNNHNAICIQEISSKIETQLTSNIVQYNANDLVFNHDSTKLAALRSKDITIWDINEPEKPTLNFTLPNSFSGGSIAFSPDGIQIAIGGSLSLPTTNYTGMYTIYIFNTSDGKLIQTLETQSTGRAQKIIFTSDGKRIIAMGYKTMPQGGQNLIYKNNLIIWNIENIEDVSYKILDYVPAAQSAFALNSNGTIMITGGSQQNKNTLELWDLSNYDNITHKTIAHLGGLCNSLAFNADDTTLVSGDGYESKLGYTNSLIRWDISNKDNNVTAENIKNCDLEEIKLLYQLYLKENVTNPSVFNDLPKDIQTILPKPSNYKATTKAMFDTSSSSPAESSWRSWFRNLFSKLNYVP
jgi:WD40 repeat protein